MIRPARPEDIPVITRLIHELAVYERAPDAVIATEEDLQAALFTANPAVFAHVAVHNDAVVGYAMWFLTYSTWLGRHGIYLEDLYVSPSVRGQGHGKALLTELAAIAVQRGYGRIEWSVLNWNKPAIDFYKSIGAYPMDDWTTYRLTNEALKNLGRRPE